MANDVLREAKRNVRKSYSTKRKYEFRNVEYTLGIRLRFLTSPIETVSLSVDFSNSESRNIMRFVLYIH